MKKHIKIDISGRVQGVFFRQRAQEEAVKLGIFGYADKLENGGIMIEAEGEEKDLEIFLQWCRRGPFLAKVELLLFKYSSESKNFTAFEIRKIDAPYVSRGLYSYY